MTASFPDPHRIVEIARTLIAFDTTYDGPGDEARDAAALQAWIAGFLRDLGFSVEVWEPDPARLAEHPMYPEGLHWRGRPVLSATLAGTGGGRSLALNGHVDTVAAEPIAGWSCDPWRGDVRDGRLYGRGSADMKGGLAAALAAAEHVVRAGRPLRGDLLVQTAPDEETTGMGLVALLDRAPRPDAALVLEPTSFDLWTAYRGILYATVAVTGRSGHGELPQPAPERGGAVSAIDKARVVLDAVDALNRDWAQRPEHRHPLLAVPQAVPTRIAGGEFIASFPGRCEIDLDLTYHPVHADGEGYGADVRSEVERHLRDATSADPWLREHPPTVRWLQDYPPAETTAEHPLVDVVREAGAAHDQPVGIAGLDTWADASTYLRAGIPAYCFGPRAMDHGHVVDEWVAIDDLERCARIMADAIARWCA